MSGETGWVIPGDERIAGYPPAASTACDPPRGSALADGVEFRYACNATNQLNSNAGAATTRCQGRFRRRRRCVAP